MFYTYILRSLKTGGYYKGSTDNLHKRLEEHNAGESKFTARDRPWEIAWFAELPDRKEALDLERKLKNITSRSRLEEFIRKHSQ